MAGNGAWGRNPWFNFIGLLVAPFVKEGFIQTQPLALNPACAFPTWLNREFADTELGKRPFENECSDQCFMIVLENWRVYQLGRIIHQIVEMSVVLNTWP